MTFTDRKYISNTPSNKFTSNEGRKETCYQTLIRFCRKKKILQMLNVADRNV